MDFLDNFDLVVLALGVFNAAIAAGLFVLYRKSAALRDALKGQEGWRLMRIFARIFAVDTFVMGSAAVRSFLFQSTSFDLARQALSLVSGLAFLWVHVWALLEVKAIINEGRSGHEAD